MKRLSVHFAMLATLVAIMAAGVTIVVCHYLYGIPFSVAVFACLIPIAIAVLALSLLIGHFLTEPLQELAKEVRKRKDGEEMQFTMYGRVSEADELADCLEELSKKAAQRQKDLSIREKNQAAFISDVAHELRTPLTAIRGNAEMLLDPDLPPELHEKFCNTIVKESERLSRLTKDLITLQKVEGGTTSPRELTRINMKDIAQEVVDMLEPILVERQANVAIEGEAPDILGNADQMKQVLSNLVENASRFIEPGGHIVISLLGLKDNCVVSVKDDGCGFGDLEDPNLLFARFYRTDLSRSRGTGGTGLGLAIVKSIVEAHDGTVEAVNLPGGGACFIVAIPAVGGTPEKGKGFIQAARNAVTGVTQR